MNSGLTTGLALKLERTARRVRVKELALAMGVSEARVSNIESRDLVTDEAARKYREALATLPTLATPDAAPSVA